MINVVNNSDCLPAMREMKDNQFDLAIVAVSILFVIFLATILSTVDIAMDTLTVKTVVMDAIAFVALVVVFYYLFDGE